MATRMPTPGKAMVRNSTCPLTPFERAESEFKMDGHHEECKARPATVLEERGGVRDDSNHGRADACVEGCLPCCGCLAIAEDAGEEVRDGSDYPCLCCMPSGGERSDTELGWI